jgi:hypothetical protein
MLNFHRMQSFHVNYRPGAAGEHHPSRGSLRYHKTRRERRRSAPAGAVSRARGPGGQFAGRATISHRTWFRAQRLSGRLRGPVSLAQRAS